MMTKKLARHGNSRALVIERPILELLGIDDATELEMRTDGKSLIFTPVAAETRREMIRRIGEDIAQKHARALRAMAGEEEGA
jgi:antitoxin component of MazEF toxin-antitoxin module